MGYEYDIPYYARSRREYEFDRSERPRYDYREEGRPWFRSGYDRNYDRGYGRGYDRGYTDVGLGYNPEYGFSGYYSRHGRGFNTTDAIALGITALISGIGRRSYSQPPQEEEPPQGQVYDTIAPSAPTQTAAAPAKNYTVQNVICAEKYLADKNIGYDKTMSTTALVDFAIEKGFKLEDCPGTPAAPPAQAGNAGGGHRTRTHKGGGSRTHTAGPTDSGHTNGNTNTEGEKHYTYETLVGQALYLDRQKAKKLEETIAQMKNEFSGQHRLNCDEQSSVSDKIGGVYQQQLDALNNEIKELEAIQQKLAQGKTNKTNLENKEIPFLKGQLKENMAGTTDSIRSFLRTDYNEIYGYFMELENGRVYDCSGKLANINDKYSLDAMKALVEKLKKENK